ncbi:MAG TPA: TraB/GumN family protein, partial [Croceibacterium sp.]|nr:TraB/GumN family protein [Croceibacterium sp.]
QDADTRIYLLGTVHLLPEGFRWRSARIDRIVSEADELVLETTDDENVTEDPRIARLLQSFAKRPGVSERLSPGNREKWLALGEGLGIDAEAFDRLPPLLALIGLGATASQQETGAQRRYGVETVLTEDFEAAGKPIGSIESATEVFLSLLALDEAVLIKELDRELTRIGDKDPLTLFGPAAKPSAGGRALEHRWAQGLDVGLGSESFGPTTFGRAMDKALLGSRNRAWAVWLERRLREPGTVLVAVGAGHLWGGTSVQAILSQRGLVAERVD